MAPADPSPIALALGRIPTGLYVVGTRDGAERPGFVGSFVMQVGFAPPTVCVAVNKERAHLGSMRRSGRFSVCVLDAASHGAMKAFFRKYPPGESPFDQAPAGTAPGGSPILGDCLAWLECRLSGEHDAGDHVVLFGVVEAAERLRATDPSVRLRSNGLDY